MLYTPLVFLYLDRLLVSADLLMSEALAYGCKSFDWQTAFANEFARDCGAHRNGISLRDRNDTDTNYHLSTPTFTCYYRFMSLK